jgi:hypothetical protein
MLGSTAAAAAWARVTPQEKAWLALVGESLSATIAARARKLLASYTPLRAVVRYWSVVAGVQSAGGEVEEEGEEKGVKDEAPNARAGAGAGSGSGTGADIVAAAAAAAAGEKGRRQKYNHGYGSSGGDGGDGGGGKNTSSSGGTSHAAAAAAAAAKAKAKAAADKAKSVAANTLGRILTGAVEGTRTIGFVGASELAAGHRRRDPSLSAGWLKYLIYSDSVVSFTGGTLLGLGGPAAAPLTAPPALAMYFTIRLRLCLAIAALGGRGVLDPWAGAATLACFFGTDAGELLAARPTLADLDAAAAATSVTGGGGGGGSGGGGGGGGARVEGADSAAGGAAVGASARARAGAGAGEAAATAAGGAVEGDGTGASNDDDGATLDVSTKSPPGGGGTTSTASPSPPGPPPGLSPAPSPSKPPPPRDNIAVRAVKGARDSVTGAMARVFEAGAAAQSAAQRASASAAALASTHVLLRGGSDEDAAAASERAYALTLPRYMVRAMGRVRTFHRVILRHKTPFK